VLHRCTELHTLLLLGNNLGVAGASQIARAVSQTTGSLEIVDISDNDIGDAGAKAFAAALRLTTSLVSLNLARNGITDSGASSIVAALDRAPAASRISAVDLVNNPLISAKMLARVHQVTPQLPRLQADNRIL